jgi:hypothetical protein
MKDWMFVLLLCLVCGLFAGGIAWLVFDFTVGVVVFGLFFIFTLMAVRFSETILS